jgi:hypothetical protein
MLRRLIFNFNITISLLILLLPGLMPFLLPFDPKGQNFWQQIRQKIPDDQGNEYNNEDESEHNWIAQLEDEAKLWLFLNSVANFIQKGTKQKRQRYAALICIFIRINLSLNKHLVRNTKPFPAFCPAC